MCGDLYLLFSALLITVLPGVVRGGGVVGHIFGGDARPQVKIWTQKGGQKYSFGQNLKNQKGGQNRRAT